MGGRSTSQYLGKRVCTCGRISGIISNDYDWDCHLGGVGTRSVRRASGLLETGLPVSYPIHPVSRHGVGPRTRL
jgi:hypothetical protein